MSIGEDFKFVYWDDYFPDKDNKKTNCSAHAKQQEEDEEEAAIAERMMIIMRNGNNGDHYEIYDDEDVDPDK